MRLNLRVGLRIVDHRAKRPMWIDRLRVEALEKPLRRERRTHLIWWDEEEESESDVRLRVERMIARGKAHPDDRFFYVSWRR